MTLFYLISHVLLVSIPNHTTTHPCISTSSLVVPQRVVTTWDLPTTKYFERRNHIFKDTRALTTSSKTLLTRDLSTPTRTDHSLCCTTHRLKSFLIKVIVLRVALPENPRYEEISNAPKERRTIFPEDRLKEKYQAAILDSWYSKIREKISKLDPRALLGRSNRFPGLKQDRIKVDIDQKTYEAYSAPYSYISGHAGSAAASEDLQKFLNSDDYIEVARSKNWSYVARFEYVDVAKFRVSTNSISLATRIRKWLTDIGYTFLAIRPRFIGSFFGLQAMQRAPTDGLLEYVVEAFPSSDSTQTDPFATLANDGVFRLQIKDKFSLTFYIESMMKSCFACGRVGPHKCQNKTKPVVDNDVVSCTDCSAILHTQLKFLNADACETHLKSRLHKQLQSHALLQAELTHDPEITIRHAHDNRDDDVLMLDDDDIFEVDNNTTVVEEQDPSFTAGPIPGNGQPHVSSYDQDFPTLSSPLNRPTKHPHPPTPANQPPSTGMQDKKKKARTTPYTQGENLMDAFSEAQ